LSLQRHDPLTPAVIDSCRRLIRDHLQQRRRCSEYELVTLLVQHNVYQWSENNLLALFQKHFIVQHCLYSLRQHFSSLSQKLNITPLQIWLSAEDRNACADTVEHDVQTPAQAQERVAAFYHELENFYQATPASVQEYLQQFWRKYDKATGIGNSPADAYKVLDLSGDESWSEVQQRFRELAGKAHPDKGGDADEFSKIKAAYDAIKARR
jgi:hypothetical protein